MDEEDRTIHFLPLPASKEMADVLALIELTRTQIHDAFILPRWRGYLPSPPHKETET